MADEGLTPYQVLRADGGCGIMGIHDHLLCNPMTSKERRSVGLVMRKTGWGEDRALDFVRTHYWHITQAPGGAEGLLKQMGHK